SASAAYKSLSPRALPPGEGAKAAGWRQWCMLICLERRTAVSDDETVEVPPGYKVVVVRPAPHTQLVPLESKYLALDFGPQADWRRVIRVLEDARTREETPNTVAILQGAMIDYLHSRQEADQFVESFAQLRSAGWNGAWVLPDNTFTRAEFVERLRAAGFGVHGAAPDGACFVEVHQPGNRI